MKNHSLPISNSICALDPKNTPKNKNCTYYWHPSGFHILDSPENRHRDLCNLLCISISAT